MPDSTDLVSTEIQLDLDLRVVAETEVNGVAMGVLNTGTPFLTIRGLSRMCGVSDSNIVRMTAEWVDPTPRPRVQRVKELVRAQGSDDSTAFYAVETNGVVYHAVPDAVCMAILEYYAFDAKPTSDQALKAFRTLARKGFRDFIYAQVGYNPSGSVDLAWQQYHDRVSLIYDTVPAGFFCIFKEIAEMQVTLLQAGATLGKSFIPDISVGQAWGKHWASDNLDVVYGQRRKFSHNYPDYFPQAMSNPQPAYCYPDDALPEFRKWMREAYVPNSMPKYLASKVKSGSLSAPAATSAVDAFKNRNLPAPQ